MRGLQWHFLAGIVITCVIIGVAIIMLLPLSGIDIKKYFGLEPVLGVPAEIAYINFPTQVGSENTPESDRIITAAGQPYQLSDLGCVIADFIYDDYKSLGETARRADFLALWDGGRSQFLVGKGTFNLANAIADVDGDSDGTGDWEELLSSRAQPCHYCGLGTPWGDNPVFDEVCINYNLRDRTITGKNFCVGAFDSDTGGPAQFGNAQCTGGSEGGCINTADWCDNCDGWWCDGLGECCGACPVPCGYPGAPCRWNNDGSDDFCDNDKEKIIWIADKPDGDPANRVRDRYTDNDWNWNRLEIDPYKYMYGVIWDDSEKQYDLLFVRVPQDRTENNFDWIKTDLKDWLRNNRIGWAYQIARTTSNVTVTGQDKNEFILRSEVATELVIDASKMVLEACNNEKECLSSTPVAPDSGTEECTVASQYGGGITAESKFKKETVKFKTNICKNANLRADRNYKVKVTNWWGKYDKQEGLNWFPCYSLVDRQVSIYCIDCCDSNGVFDPLWESRDCADFVPSVPCA